MWKVADLDLMMLANKYWVHGWSYDELGRHFGLAANTDRRKIIRIRVAAKEGVEPWVSTVRSFENEKA